MLTFYVVSVSLLVLAGEATEDSVGAGLLFSRAKRKQICIKHPDTA
jgi:hypothetical protein